MALPLLLFLLLNFRSTAAYSSSYCLTSGVTWSSPVSAGIQSVGSPEECQQLCADSRDCDSITWYGAQATPHPEYCELFLSPDQSKEVPCADCMSGPETCMCSGEYTCSLDSDQLIELLFSVTSEFLCAELCYDRRSCVFYSWYDGENPSLTNACALLRGCTKRTHSTTCRSGPSDCTDVDILSSDYPLCFETGKTWSQDTSRGLANITSPYDCQELCNEDAECSSFTWFSILAEPYQNFCAFFPAEFSKPTLPCTDCVSGLSSCVCSVADYQTCDTSQETVIDILLHIESELKCQDLCARHETCSWYTWYSEEGDRFQFTCILLDSCNKKTQCQGCTSGPDNCEDTEIMSLPPQCTGYRQLTSHTRNVISKYFPYLCNGHLCCDKFGETYTHSDWAGDDWYRFSGEAGTKIVETPTVYLACGTQYGGYMVGGHPTVADGEVTRTVYFDNGGDHQHYPTNITVFNCRDYFVYYLTDLTFFICSGYCGE